MFYPTHMEKTYTISGVAGCIGVSIDTLRYYERIGLIHGVGRLSNTHRRYTESDIQWIQFLLRLRATGMSIQQMLVFARLRRLGEATLRERVAMLKAHRDQVEAHVQQMQAYLVVLDDKITMYESTWLSREAGKVKEYNLMSWKIDPVHSAVSFTIRHMMVSTVRGRFNVVRGHLHIDEEQPVNSWVEAEVDAASIDTHNDQRDAHLRSADFFDTAIYPLITLKSTQVEPLGGPDYRVTGDLTMHGVTKSVTFETEYNGQSLIRGVQRAGLTAKTKLNRKDFNLGFGSIAEAGQVALSEMVTIEIDLELVQSGVQEAAAQ